MPRTTDRDERVPVTTATVDHLEPDSARGARHPNQRDLQKAATRRRLLEAATDVFIEQGPMTASLEEIASRAGVSRPTLIFHFGTRADLVDAVAAFHQENFRDWGNEFAPGQFRPYVEAFLASQRDPVVRLAWSLGTLTHPGGETHDRPDIPNQNYWRRFSQLEDRIAKSAGVSEDEAHRRAVLIAPALLMTAQRAAQDLSTHEQVREFIDAVCEFALAPGGDRSLRRRRGEDGGVAEGRDAAVMTRRPSCSGP